GAAATAEFVPTWHRGHARLADVVPGLIHPLLLDLRGSEVVPRCVYEASNNFARMGRSRACRLCGRQQRYVVTAGAAVGRSHRIEGVTAPANDSDIERSERHGRSFHTLPSAKGKTLPQQCRTAARPGPATHPAGELSECIDCAFRSRKSRPRPPAERTPFRCTSRATPGRSLASRRGTGGCHS